MSVGFAVADPSSGLLEHETVMLQQLAFKADAVRADARGERQPEVGARQPSRHQPELEEALAPARLGEPRSPLLDRLDVVEPPARALDEAEMRLGGADDLLL